MPGLVVERRAVCWHCATDSETRVRHDPRYRCTKCADADLDPIEPYTVARVEWAFANYLSWHLQGSRRSEYADLSAAVEWARESSRLSDFEKYTMTMRLIDRSSLKAVAYRFDVTDSAVSRTAKKVCRKVAAWLNSPQKGQFG